MDYIHVTLQVVIVKVKLSILMAMEFHLQIFTIGLLPLVDRTKTVGQIEVCNLQDALKVLPYDIMHHEFKNIVIHLVCIYLADN